MYEPWEQVWSFTTERFTVTLAVRPEEDDPTDHFEFTDDVEFANEGGWHWFQARVQVFVEDDHVLGEDYLGGCSYHNLEDFKRGGYFRDMVRTAVADARQTLHRLATLESSLR